MEQLDIRQLVGETTEYDKKQALEVKKPKSWCKSVSAFANGIGGKLVWGIADDDALVGLADAKGDAEKISEAIKTHIDPIPDFNLSFAKCEDKEFVVLDVMPGKQTVWCLVGDLRIWRSRCCVLLTLSVQIVHLRIATMNRLASSMRRVS